jgi:hydroxymethylglutaryl-CoA reductase
MDQEKKKEELALWHGFYLKSLYERQAQIALCYPDLLPSPLDPILADSLIENCIGVLGLPLGLGINLSVNNETCLVPIATEEPRYAYS